VNESDTMVVSWMDPKLLMKMFTRSSTGIPKNKRKKQTKLISQHIKHTYKTRRPKVIPTFLAVHFLTDYYG